MNLPSDEFIRFYSKAVHPKASQISPILVSPFTSTEDSLQVQVILKPKPELKVEQDDYPSYKIIKDNSCFYQISCQNLMTLVQKIYNNRCVWKIPAFFPAKFVAASLGQELLFVGLSDKTISILDTNTGVCCFPSIFVEDRIIFLVSEENYLICFTSNNILMVWEIVNNKDLKSIVHEKYEGPKLGDIQKVILTNELENDSISPIIFAENITVRFSKTRNGWINTNSKVPSIFNKCPGFRTIHDVEKGFFESLINDEIEEFQNCMQILLQKYLISKHYSHVIKLVNQLLDIIHEGKTNYCGMNPKELLDFMLNVIVEINTEVVDLIKNSKEYNDAFNPTPHPPPIVHEPQEVHQPLLLQANNSNISQEQQDVIDLIYKSQPNKKDSSIITQPNISIPESEKQDETFIWPISNTHNQSSAKEPENTTQEPQMQLNENHEVPANSIVTSPNKLEEPSHETETDSESKIKSYNEDDSLAKTQKYVSESLTQPPIFNNIPSPPRSDKTKKNASPAEIPASNIVSSEVPPSPTQKASVNSPSKQQKKKGTKQTSLFAFLPKSTEKSEQKDQETQVVEEKKTKSPSKKKVAVSQDIHQAFTQQEPDEVEPTEEKTQEVQSQQQSMQQRRSPRASKKVNIDNSPEPKKKATPKKKVSKAKNKGKENEQQQQVQENEQKEEEPNQEENNQQEIQTPKKNTRKSTPKRATKNTSQIKNPFQSESDSTPINSQPLPSISQQPDAENEFIQPIANSEEPAQFLSNKTDQLSQPNAPNNPIISPQIYQSQQQQQMSMPSFQIPPELKPFINNPRFQSTSDFKSLDQKFKDFIVEYQKINNIKPKRKTKSKNLSQQPQIQSIQPQIQEQQQQQSAEANVPGILTPTININNPEQETKKVTQKKKTTKPRKARAAQKQQQQEEGQEQKEVHIDNPPEEFITSIESNKNEQESDSGSLPAKKAKSSRTRSKKKKNQEGEDGVDNGQKQEKKKSTRKQRKKKEEKSMSQAPLHQISNDDENLSAPTINEEGAQELAEKMQEDEN